MYVVLRVYKIYFVGDWSNGMIGVSKTFGGSSILSSPADSEPEIFLKRFPAFYFISKWFENIPDKNRNILKLENLHKFQDAPVFVDLIDFSSNPEYAYIMLQRFRPVHWTG